MVKKCQKGAKRVHHEFDLYHDVKNTYMPLHIYIWTLGKDETMSPYNHDDVASLGVLELSKYSKKVPKIVSMGTLWT